MQRCEPARYREPHRAGFRHHYTDAVPDTSPLAIGALLGDRYRADELLSIGGMGAVYAGTHTLLQKRVAIKVLVTAIYLPADAADRPADEVSIRLRITPPSAAVTIDEKPAIGSRVSLERGTRAIQTLSVELEKAEPSEPPADEPPSPDGESPADPDGPARPRGKEPAHEGPDPDRAPDEGDQG